VRSYGVEVVVFAIALTLFGLVALALVWSEDWAYAALANATGNTHATLIPGERRDVCGQEVSVDLARLLELHRGWSTYVTGLSTFAPGPACSLWTPAEYAHMADVRNVFRGAELVAVLALGIVGFRTQRAIRDGRALRLVRDGALVAAGIVVGVGVAAVLAFDQLFLLFHELLFPRGNFLFPPESNLLRLYPEWYWQGITAGVGISFIVVALLAAWLAHVALHRRSTTYTRAA